MIYTVDRIEGDRAVLEDENRQMSDLSLAELPAGLREGDLLERTSAGWTLRPELREQRLARNRALLEKLKRRNR
ncbi:MAG: DUF3006 domain-containing protein [Candidatus Onthomonas sp.]